jgi:battenin
MYQAGVFLSRSTGVCFVVPMPILWLMPILQCINVWFYWTIASNQLLMTAADHPLRWLYTPVVLYSASFYTGLLGGAVYIHGYLRICHDLPIEHREFSLSATSLAESLGIVLADIFGLVVQSCLYQINGLKGAVITCPT